MKCCLIILNQVNSVLVSGPPIYLLKARHINKEPCASCLRLKCTFMKYFNTSASFGGPMLPQSVREIVFGTISIHENIY